MAYWYDKWVKKPRGAMPIDRLSNQARGLYAYWPVFEADNLRLTDASGRGATGIAINAPTLAASPLGKGMQFNGSNQYITMSSAISGGFQTWQTTVSVRVKFNSLPGGTENSMMMQVGSDSATWGVGLELYGSNVRFMIVNQTPTALTVTGNVTVVAGKWYTITAVHDGSTLKIYINGVLDNSVSASSTSLRSNGGSLTLGGLNPTGGRYLNGVMEDVRLYNRAFTYGEVQELYANPLGLFSTQHGYYPDVVASGTTYYQTAAATATSTGARSTSVVHTYTQTAAATATTTATATVSKNAVPNVFQIASQNTSGLYYSSNNGTSWSSATCSASSCYGRKWNGSYWVGVSNYTNTAVKSTNGISWSSYTITNGSTSLGCISWSASLGIWVTGWANGAIYTSPDGTTWTQRTPADASQNWNACAWSPSLGKFVITSRTSAVFNYSSDGITWYSSGSSQGVLTGTWNDVCWTGTAFIAVDQNTTTRMLRSTDGINWSTVTVPSNNYWYVAVNGTGTVVAVSDSSSTCLVSTDNGVTWATKALGGSSYRWGPGGVAYNGTNFMVAAFDSTTWYISTDGLSWASITSPALNTLEIEAAWLPTYGSSTTYTQYANAAPTSTATISSLRTRIVVPSAAAPTSTSVKASNANVSKAGSTTVTATRPSWVTSSIKTASPSSVPAILRNTTSIHTATTTSTGSSLAQRAALLATAALATVTSTLKNAISWAKSTSVTTTANTSKAALLNKAITVSSTSTMVRTGQLVKSVLSTTTSTISRQANSIFKVTSTTTASIVKRAFNTFKATTSDVASFASTYISGMLYVTAAALSTITSSIIKSAYVIHAASSTSSSVMTRLAEVVRTAVASAVATYKDIESIVLAALVTTSASVHNMLSLLRSMIAMSITTALKKATVFTTKSIDITTSAAMQRDLSLTHVTTVSSTSTIVKAITARLTSAYSTTTAATQKLINKITSALVVVSAFKVQSFYLMSLAIANTTSTIKKAITTTKSTLVISISTAVMVYHALVALLVSFFVTIADTKIFRQEVKVFEYSTMQLDSPTEHTLIQIPQYERTTLRITNEH